MGWITLIGLLLGFGALIVANLMEGGSLSGLVNIPGFIMVFGGTFGTACIAFPPQVILNLPKTLGRIFVQKLPDANQIVVLMAELADKARRQGLLSLEEEGDRQADPFLRKGIQMVVDGSNPESIRQMLEADSESMVERHAVNYALLEAMGGYAPTMGIIGTVMGLVSVLGHLGGDPSALGESIATAFLATLYGVGTANLLWLPLGSKLKQISEQELLLRRVTTEGLLAIQAGDNPRSVRMRLEAFLPPDRREKVEQAPNEASAKAA